LSRAGLNFDICRGRREPAPKVAQIFPKILVRYLQMSPHKTRTPTNLVHMNLCRQMSSMSNESVIGTLCEEGAERQPPNVTAIFA